MNNEVNAVRESFGAITVDKVSTSDYQKEGTMTAQLRQVVTTTYPSKQVASSNEDSLFDPIEDFGFTGESYDRTRMAFVNVPTGTTPEQVAAQLAKMPNARIQRQVANQPVLSREQKYAIDQKITTLDVIANKQIVRVDGNIVLDDNKKPQYRITVFKREAELDIDLRDSDPENVYYTPEIQAELGQTVTAESDAILDM